MYRTSIIKSATFLQLYVSLYCPFVNTVCNTLVLYLSVTAGGLVVGTAATIPAATLGPALLPVCINQFRHNIYTNFTVGDMDSTMSHIKVTFPERACFCFPLPVSDFARLGHLQYVPDTDVVLSEDGEDPDAFCFCTGPQKGVNAEEWVVDSGVTTHMTWDKGVFVTYAAMEDMPSVRLGDGRTVKAEGKGSVCLRIRDNKQAERKISLSRVLFVPDLSCNLFSVRDITDKGNRMMFDDITCNVITRGDIVIASGYKRGNLYVLDGTADRQPDEALVAAQPSSDLWHQRLAHVNDKMLDKLVSCDVSGVDLKTVEPRSFCEGCVQGKATKHKLKPLGEIRSTRRLEKVHSDVCGPMQTASNSGKKYMVTFVDDYSRTCAVYFMAHKSDTFAMFQEFHAKVAGESGERIGVLKTDGGGEYRSREFADYLRKQQIAHEVTVPDSPEMIGIAERMNRTILEKAKCMCVHADLPKSLWAEVLHATCTTAYQTPP